MASEKKTTSGATTRKPKPLKLGTTAAEVYRLAEGILDAKRWLIAGIADAQRWLAVSPTRVFPIPEDSRRYDVEAWADHKERYTNQLERLRAARKMFEARLVVDPADAVRRIQALKSMTHVDIRQASGGGDPVMKAALGVAVEHVEEWLKQREGKPVAWIPAPAAALQAIALPSAIGERPPEESILPRRFDADDLERLAKNTAVARARKGNDGEKRGGFKDAAIAIVSLATGQGVQTVRRAAQSR